MQHNYFEEGHVFRLRPVSLTDAAFIIRARQQNTERNRFLTPISGKVADQETWLRAYFEREDDFYFVIENRATGQPEGLVGVWNYDATNKVAEWGRWVVLEQSSASIESAFLVHRFCMETLGLESMYSSTPVTHENVLSFHHSFGAEPTIIDRNYAIIDGISHDAQRFEVTSTSWPAIKKRLAPVLERMATKS